MIFEPLALPGSFLVEPQRLVDERGFFARSFCREEFSAQGLRVQVDQCNISFNPTKGTVRGMHYQRAPCEEEKLVRCTSGSVHDVIVDLRPDSSTFLQHVEIELSANNRYMLYIPAGIAHGFQTLEDDSEVFYQMFGPYQPDYAAGVRWNDPSLNIQWPMPVTLISERDLSYEDISA